ncbi:hypothetical protein SLEP1_g31886 [Rubroshorea leprosula]|uniref:Secreted protein n=1 Tax=Rubroshorea leprosula TaxID=152421 RepID=A0AAV5KBM0_9ROSI|nr:hypothetical protein SLEP1_g31886 [Rubroshorea leprosula]
MLFLSEILFACGHSQSFSLFDPNPSCGCSTEYSNSDHKFLTVCNVLPHNLHLSRKRRGRNTAVSGNRGWESEMEALERLGRPV